MPDILIYDQIGGGGVNAQDIIQQLDRSGGSINIRINSPGGNATEGIAIYNAIKRQSGNTITTTDASAYSAASLIAIAGDKTVMAENALFMIHNPFTIAVGDSKQMHETADTLKKLEDIYVNAYAKKTGKSAVEINQMMDDETWMNAREAKAHGFIDEIAQADGVMAMASFNASDFKFKHAPQMAMANQQPSDWKQQGFSSLTTYQAFKRAEQKGKVKVTSGKCIHTNQSNYKERLNGL
jgi:ATP-dependent Clp protease, protease subunit